MIDGKKMIAAVFVAAAMSTCLRADMMPTSCVAAASLPSVRGGGEADLPSTHLPGSLVEPGMIDLEVLSATCLPGAGENVTQASESRLSAQVLEDQHGSFDLCVYALVGLGLFRSGHYVRKSGLTFVPEWYHNGGPWQIGHNHVVGPDLLRSATVACFVQPDVGIKDSMPRYRRKIRESLWRTSQFTPATLASRGPPSWPMNPFLREKT